MSGRYDAGVFAADYDKIIDFLTRCQAERSKHRPLAILVFAHEAAKTTKENLLPYLEYWHYRSGNAVDIVFPGYTGDSSLGDYRAFVEPVFHEKAFVEVLKKFEELSTWKYSGQPSIIILSAARPTTPKAKVDFDFREVVSFDLDRALADGVIRSVQTTFETVIRIADERAGDISQYSLSDVLGTGTFGSILVDALGDNFKPIKPLPRLCQARQTLRTQDLHPS